MASGNPQHGVAGAVNAVSPRPRLSLVAVFMVVLLLMQAACSTAARHNAALPEAAASVQVYPEKAATLRLRNGFQVLVPAGAVTRAGRLTVTARSASRPAPATLELAGPVYELHLRGAGLRRTVKISIPVPLPRQSGVAAGPDAATLAYYDATAGQWRWIPSTYDLASHTLSASIPHLSDWAAIKLNPQQVLDAIRGALLGFLGVASTPRPDCRDSASLASSGVQVTADTGDLVSWCPDVTSTGIVLRIVSNRTYALEADYRPDWSASLAGTVDPVTSAILKDIPALSLRTGGSGIRTSIIPGGGELDVTPQPGTSGRVLIAPTAEGIIIDALTYAATTLAMVYSRLPGAAASTAVKTSEVISEIFTDGVCVNELSAAYRNPDVSTSQAAGGLFHSLTDIASSCLAKYWPKIYQVSGPSAALITSTLLWAADGIKLIFTNLHALADNALNPLGVHIDLRLSPLSTAPPTTAPPTTAPPSTAPPTTTPPTQQNCAKFALTSSAPTSGPAGGGTLIVIRGSGLSSVNNVVMNPVQAGSNDPTLHPNFSVVSDSEIDVTTPAGVSGVTYEIDFFTPHCEYFSTNFSGIPRFTFK